MRAGYIPLGLLLSFVLGELANAVFKFGLFDAVKFRFDGFKFERFSRFPPGHTLSTLQLSAHGDRSGESASVSILEGTKEAVLCGIRLEELRLVGVFDYGFSEGCR